MGGAGGLVVVAGGDVPAVEPDQRIDLAVVRFRILQQGGDDVGLILTGDGGVPPGAHGQSMTPLVPSVAQYQSSHSAKNVGRRCVVSMGVRSSSRSAIQWCCAAWLVASTAACAKSAVASSSPGAIGLQK